MASLEQLRAENSRNTRDVQNIQLRERLLEQVGLRRPARRSRHWECSLPVGTELRGACELLHQKSFGPARLTHWIPIPRYCGTAAGGAGQAQGALAAL